MRNATLAVVLVLSAALVAALPGDGDAAKRKTFCQKAVAARKGTKVVAHKAGVTVYRHGRTINACSDAHRFAAGLYIMDPGYKVAKVGAARKRCLSILFTGAGKLPQILFKDLGGREAGSSISIIGFNQAAAAVGSMSVTRNCATAWGESVTDAAGTTTYRVRVKGFGTANALQTGVVTDVATVDALEDIRHVSAVASGRQVTVRWTQGGATQTKTLP